jgi:O-antigen ligase
LLYGVVALFLLVGLIFTRSPAGITLSMLAVLLSAAAFPRRIGGSDRYVPTGSVVAFAVGIGITVGLLVVLDRFSASEPIQQARWPIFSATLDGIDAFLPVGSGPGTYVDVFPAFQPLELGRWLINHAHNDYLEWLLEGGLLAALLMLFLLVLYARQWRRVWPGEQWSRFRFVQVGAGIGLLLLLLHSLVDYNLRMPANVAVFSFLAGVFFVSPGELPQTARRRGRRTPKLAEISDSPPERESERPPADQIPNPFLD